MAGSLGDLGGLLRQAKKMQKEVAEMQNKLADKNYEGKAGGGAVVVTITGAYEFKNITISPEVVDADDVEMLEDLVAVAVKDVLQQITVDSADSMKGVTGGMGLPGMPGMPGM
ncbi:MAG: YbaB/EbfC family nucleoid-associated protein [Planctomycetes bacterium]|nr:YbaB/EbfC family nucleoid-associated protein [Planctomycetota bacterium]